MKNIFKFIISLIAIIFLTVLTQIGGIVLLSALTINHFSKYKFRFQLPIVFFTLYFIATLLIVPLIAPQFGRERIAHSETIQPAMILTDLLNRNYVRPELNVILRNTEKDLSQVGIQTNYLDANFPFFNGFPLLPHLSHNDGKKLDLSLVYKNEKGAPSTKVKSNSGYGVFETPTKSEYDQIGKCKLKGYWQYDFSKYLTLGQKNKQLKYSNMNTRKLVQSILANKSVGKIFIEPHLKQRMNIKDNRIRYHGCGAVRHDDHIHIQLK